jgi:hypothetical protein
MLLLLGPRWGCFRMVVLIGQVGKLWIWDRSVLRGDWLCTSPSLSQAPRPCLLLWKVPMLRMQLRHKLVNFRMACAVRSNYKAG